MGGTNRISASKVAKLQSLDERLTPRVTLLLCSPCLCVGFPRPIVALAVVKESTSIVLHCGRSVGWLAPWLEQLDLASTRLDFSTSSLHILCPRAEPIPNFKASP